MYKVIAVYGQPSGWAVHAPGYEWRHYSRRSSVREVDVDDVRRVAQKYARDIMGAQADVVEVFWMINRFIVLLR